MQGKDELINDILMSAKKTSAAMIDEARAELDATVAELREKAESQNAEADKAAAEAADAVYSGKVKLGTLEAGKVMLDYKRRCVDAVYDEVRKKLVAMPDSAYLALMQKLIAGACSDGDEVVAGKSDKRITADFVKKTGSAAKKKLTLSKEKGDFEFGVVLKNDKFDVDLTLDEIMAELRDRTIADTAQKLHL